MWLVTVPSFRFGEGREKNAFSRVGPAILIQTSACVTRITRGAFLAWQTNVKRHHPLLGSLLPIDFRVAVGLGAGDVLQNRVAAELGEVASVSTGGDGLPAKCGGVDENQRRLAWHAKAAGVLPVHHRRAAEHVPRGVGR